MKKPKAIAFGTLTASQRAALGSYLVDRAHDLEVDRESLEEEEGFDFVAALRGLGDALILDEVTGV